MKSENVKKRPLTKLDEYAILISKHWKRSKTDADGCDPTSILVNFKEGIKVDVKNELISDGWAKTTWHKVEDGDLPEYTGSYLVICGDESSPEYNVDFYENFWYGKRWVHNEGKVIAWAKLPEYKE